MIVFKKTIVFETTITKVRRQRRVVINDRYRNDELYKNGRFWKKNLHATLLNVVLHEV